ncbi:NAD(P)-dependent oxidoreductase [Myxococcus stipitatus]|uniref:NAD(P)-dependent oxidoreductase n=1 Tax=Myxococcus stipitatus TaxID=83455 RepID=UPI0030D39E4F
MYTQQSDVTVIGLGKMGAALARAFLTAGHRVTVWNRTANRAPSLRQAGAAFEASAGAAIQASPLVVVCVSDATATRAILAAPEVATALAGRTLVQLSSSTPQEARVLDAWVRGQGADFLSGAILAWPSQIGTEQASIVVSGPSAVLRRHESMLRALVGTLEQAGEAVGAACALCAAVLSYMAGHWLGFAHGARICEAEGLKLSDFGETLAAFAPGLGQDSRHMARVIESGRFANPETSLETVGGDIARLVQLSREGNLSDALPRFAAGIFQQALAAGYGAEETAAVFKVLQGVR